MSSLWKAGICTALAILLSVSLTHIATKSIPPGVDTCTNFITVEQPILTIDETKLICMCPRPGVPGLTYLNMKGIYARDGVPQAAAVTAGLVLPAILLVIAGFLALGTLTGWLRIVFAVTLMLAGMPHLIFAVLGQYNEIASKGGWYEYWLHDPLTPYSVLLTAFYALLSGWGVGLLFKAGRERKDNSAG
jgi:hypothetical protein